MTASRIKGPKIQACEDSKYHNNESAKLIGLSNTWVQQDEEHRRNLKRMKGSAHLKQEEAHESTHQKQKWHKKSKIAASSNNPEEK
jgi:hypothetical protein